MTIPRAALALSVSLLVVEGIACSGSHPSQPRPVVFGIHEGEPRPPCTCTLTRTDFVTPQTVDTESWGAPQKVGPAINTDCPEDDAEIADDGSCLYFYGAPIANPGATEVLTGTTGVYYAQRTGGPGDFGTPVFVELRKGTQGASDGHPRLMESEHLVYFHSTRSDNTGYQQQPLVDDPLDVYVADLVGFVASPARNLGTAVNSTHYDGEPEISPDGLALYFASDRPGGLGGLDLYRSVRSGDAWGPAVNLGAPINSSANDTQAAFAAGDSSTLYFVSDRGGIGMAIYRSQRSGTTWSNPQLVVRGQVGSPSLTATGDLLYFVHVQTDTTSGAPVFGADIYYLQRR